MAGICEYRTLLGTDVNATSDEILRAYSCKKSELEELLRDARLSFDRKNDIFIQINQLRRAYQTLLINMSHEHMRLQQQAALACLAEASNGGEQPQDDGQDAQQTPETPMEEGPAQNDAPEPLQVSPAPEQIKESTAIDMSAENKQKEERPAEAPAAEEAGEDQQSCCGLFWFCC